MQSGGIPLAQAVLEIRAARRGRAPSRGDVRAIAKSATPPVAVRRRIDRQHMRIVSRERPKTGSRRGFEAHLNVLDDYFAEIDGLLTLGRQGLFVHDNAHHALYMGYCAAACLDERGRFDRERWQSYRRIFATHVVED